MTVLETAAFAMPANEAAILAITVPATSHSAATATRDDALDEEGRDVRHGGKGGNGNGHPQPQLFPHWLTARLAAQLPSIAASQQSKVTRRDKTLRSHDCYCLSSRVMWRTVTC